MKELLALDGVNKVVGDQCQLGQEFDKDPVKKATGWLSNSAEVLKLLGTRCEGRGGQCSRPGGGIHRICNGKVAKAAQVYPFKLCKTILRGFRNQLVADGLLIRGVEGLQRPEVNICDADETLCQLCPMPRAPGQQAEFCDAITGQPLRADMVRAARKDEMEYFTSKRVWETATRQEARRRRRRVNG